MLSTDQRRTDPARNAANGAVVFEGVLSAVAEGISPDGNQIPGWIVYDGSGSSWPVVWNFLGNGYARNWIALSGTPTVVPTGKTLAANNAGEAVGWFIRTSPGAVVRRAFRTLSTSPTTIHPTDELPPPVDASQDTSEALAIIGPNPIDDRGNGYAPLEQLAVGRYVEAVGAVDIQTAIAWKKRPTISSKAVPVKLGRLRDPNLLLFDNSEAIGVNRYGRIVGASWGRINYPLPSSPETLWSRAFVASGPVEDSVRDLNDQHFVRKDPSWVLERAVAINDNNYIVCVGQNLAGVTRAYLLIPRIPGN